MTQLDDVRHEVFAHAIARGKSAGQAYVGAGYKPKTQHSAEASGHIV